MIIGLTGSMGSGKSTVSGILRKLGAAVIDADRISREILAPGAPALSLIRDAFGDGVFDAQGTIDREKLAELVFSDGAARETLNAIVHPLVLDAMRAQTKRKRSRLVFWDVPLLIESGQYRYVDGVWLVTAPDELRLRRVMQRGALSREQAEARFQAQMPQAEKAKFATVVIDNSGEMSELREKVKQLYASVLGRSKIEQ